MSLQNILLRIGAVVDRLSEALSWVGAVISLPLLLATTAMLMGALTRVSAAELRQTGNGPTNALKEVLLREDGQDRHRVIKSNSPSF